MKITKGLIEGALIGGGLGALLGAAGGKKSTVAAGAAGGAVVGGAIGYGLQGLAWDIEHFKFPNPFQGLEDWFAGLGKGLSEWEKSLSQWEQNVAKAAAAVTHPVSYPGVPIQEAAVQTGTGGAMSQATSPIHGTAVYLPRVTQLEAGMSIKGVPLFGPFPPNYLTASQFQQALTAQGELNPNFPGATVVMLPGSSSSKTQKIQGYVPGGGY